MSHLFNSHIYASKIKKQVKQHLPYPKKRLEFIKYEVQFFMFSLYQSHGWLSVLTSPSGIAERSCVKLSIYLACVHRFQYKWTTLKHPPSHLQGEFLFAFVYAQLKICHLWDKTHPLRHHFPKFTHFPSPVHPPPVCPSRFPALSLTVQPAHWLCFPSPGASWHQAARGEWRKAQSSAAQMNHLCEWHEKKKVKMEKRATRDMTKIRASWRTFASNKPSEWLVAQLQHSWTHGYVSAQVFKQDTLKMLSLAGKNHIKLHIFYIFYLNTVKMLSWSKSKLLTTQTES